MTKFKSFFMAKLPMIGFVAFVYGVMLFVVGRDINLTHHSVLGGITALIGFYLFIYGNMLETEQKGENQHWLQYEKEHEMDRVPFVFSYRRGFFEQVYTFLIKVSL